MRAICTYVRCTKAITNIQDIRSSLTVKSSFANILRKTGQICMIKLMLENAHQTISNDIVRRGSHWGGSPQNGLRDERTCGTTLASAYVLCRLSAAWSQLQMKKRKSEWK